MQNQGSFQSKRISVADHSIGTEIESLMQKVNLNSAFLSLAKNDSELVSEMKNAIVQLWNQARRREVLYIAIEHNVKYLTAIAQASDHAKDLALNEVAQLKVEFAKQKVDFDEMQRVNKQLGKDSEQLAIERKRITQLTLDVTKAKEKEEQMAGQLKEALKKLKNAEKNLEKLETEFEDQKKKLDWTEEQHANLQKEHKSVTQKELVASQDVDMLRKANDSYREVIVRNEAVLTKQNAELKELKKITETSKNNADRLKEENEVLLKQNANLVSDLQNNI